MADAFRKKPTSAAASSAGSPTSRLQRRRPASLQISPASAAQWNVAIPLLSPLTTSPTAVDRSLEVKSQPQQQAKNHQGTEAEKPVVFKKWQHPAAPFNYEPGAFVPKFFVPV
ncbi:hypothetical protein Tsubulata_050863 [Turnera subulata]|uniref:Uncharacterized protein n=1 Tax=Turnera subulata TaxID=218843 RepID=A0A9Q0JNH6_9ROSI|nr:hypothetical protein Tsubulata_050863 [Turnera subulata]